MPINFIPNDPNAENDLPMRQQSPRRYRPASRASFNFEDQHAPEGKYEFGTLDFLFWQSREAALAAVEAWEEFAGNLTTWADRSANPKRIDLSPVFQGLGQGIAQAVHRCETSLGQVSSRLRGLVAYAAESVLVASSGPRAAVLGALPESNRSEDEVAAYVGPLLKHDGIALSDGGARRRAPLAKTGTRGLDAIAGAPDDSETSLVYTHVIRPVAGKKILTRVRSYADAAEACAASRQSCYQALKRLRRSSWRPWASVSMLCVGKTGDSGPPAGPPLTCLFEASVCTFCIASATASGCGTTRTSETCPVGTTVALDQRAIGRTRR